MQRGPGNALVTGGARRLGRAIVRDLAAHGWNIGIHHHRSAAAAAALTGEVEGQGARAVALGADLSVWEQSAALVGRAAAALGPITLLINNAAIFEHDRPGSVTRESWGRHLDLDLRAPLVLTQSLLAFAHKGPSKRTVLALGRRINEVRELLLRTIPKKISIRARVDDDLHSVNADPDRITHALMNVCLNAVEALQGEGELRWLRVEGWGGAVQMQRRH